MFNPDDYIVGWICALATEYVAAQEFLDEEYGGPEYVSPNDSNDYTLGNQLMKDALVRDKLATEEDVLCFEMEAAGLMNHFLCVVVCGICDYSDSHKNKEWKGYAAMVAAAYAKDLLNRITPSRVEAEKKILDLLPHMLDTVSRTETNINGMKSTLDRKEDLEILDWLTPINYGAQQSDFIRRWQEGTGKWLLDSTEFKEWVETKNRTLFCPGIPGAGKTILTSIAVDKLMTMFENDSSTMIAYIYCNFRRRNEQKIDDLLAKHVEALYHRQKTKRARPSLKDISGTLQSVTSKYLRVFIVVDALDECQSEDSRNSLLSERFHLQELYGINIFTTSRHVPEIIDRFQGRSKMLEIRASRQDVHRYLENRIIQLPRFVQENQDLQQKIKEDITIAADGMFLLVQIYISLLKDKTTPNEIKDALKDFGKQDLEPGKDQKVQTLTKAYKQTMDRINEQMKVHKELAVKVLSWITCAKRQLTKSELLHALATKEGKTELDQDDMPCINDTVSVCLGLVTIDEESDILRLVHYTTQEYFERTQEHWFPDAETDITKSCVTYLSFSVFGSGFCKTDDEFEERLRLNQLYDYAARNWGHHALEASKAAEQLILSFLENETKISASTQAMLAFADYGGYSQRVPKHMLGPHLAAYFGLRNVLVLLLENEYFPNWKDSYDLTPLSYATEKRHEAIAMLLLEKGADVEIKDRHRRTPLSYTAIFGYEPIAKLLLEKGADI